MEKIRKRNLHRRRRKIAFLGTFFSVLLILLAVGVYLGVSEIIRYSTGIYPSRKEIPEKIFAGNTEQNHWETNGNDTDNIMDNHLEELEETESAAEESLEQTSEQAVLANNNNLPIYLPIRGGGEGILIETGEMTSVSEREAAAEEESENETALGQDSEPETSSSTEIQQPAAAVVSFESLEKPTYIKIVAVGDNLMHRSVSMSGIREDGSFNYDYNFSKIAPTIQSADLAIINQEVVIGGNELGIQDYPSFNGRTEMADAIVRVGFDVVLAATNHVLDQGVGAALHMINYFKTSYPQINLLGIHENWEVRDEVQVADVSGIRIAMINYTDILNSTVDYNGQEYIVDYLDYDRLAGLIAKAKATSDFVIVFPHWGTEYNLGVDAKQQEEVQFLAEQGVDLVIGTHPHVVEPMSYITRPDGEPMLVYYSLGNYQSIQNKEATQIGGMAVVELCKTWRGVSISDFDMKFLANDFRMSPGFRDYYDIVTTYPWEQYSRELADTSWVHHDNANFNTDYMFQLQAQMQEQVTTERRNAGLE